MNIDTQLNETYRQSEQRGLDLGQGREDLDELKIILVPIIIKHIITFMTLTLYIRKRLTPVE
jgi:hypothetical protein